MDTLTHAFTGLGLAALASIDPNIATNPEAMKAIIVATAIGSQLPDLDVITRFSSTSAYLRHHRGFSHNITALLLGSVAIASGVFFFFPEISWLTLWLWSALAVGLHIFLDVLNSYGTRVIRSKKVAWDIIQTVDPFILLLSVLGGAFWYFDLAQPSLIFGNVYGIMMVYIWLRYCISRRLRNQLLSHFSDIRIVSWSIVPTFSLTRWNFVVEDPICFYIGNLELGIEKISIEKVFEKPRDSKAIELSLPDPHVQAFLSAARHVHTEVVKTHTGHMVVYKDLRQRVGQEIPFSVYVLLNDDYEVIDKGMGLLKPAL